MSIQDKAIINIENVGGFIFDIDGTCQHSLESDITDHYVEDNTFVQDHWALKPEKIILKNYQGELINSINVNETISNKKLLIKPKINILNVDTNLNPDTGEYEDLFNFDEVGIKGDLEDGEYFPLDSIDSIINDLDLPQEGQSKQEVINKTRNSILDLKPKIPTEQSLLSSLSPDAPLSIRQKYAYEFFKNIRKNRILISCITPYGSFNNMAIENIVVFQDEDTKTMTGFTITLKEIRFADTVLVPYNNGKTKSQKSENQKKKSAGKVKPSPSLDNLKNNTNRSVSISNDNLKANRDKIIKNITHFFTGK